MYAKTGFSFEFKFTRTTPFIVFTGNQHAVHEKKS